MKREILCGLVMVAIAVYAAFTGGCGSSQNVSDFPYDPAKMPLDAYFSCDLDGDLTEFEGVDVQCFGTFAVMTCETRAGISLQCAAGIATRVPLIGRVAGTLYVDGGAEAGSDGFEGEAEACLILGPFGRCAEKVSE